MPAATQTWQLVHAERAALADTLDGLAADQWAAPSLCAGWTVQVAAAHVVAGAEQTPGGFFKGMATNGFRFNTMMDRTARRLGTRPPAELIARLRARTTTTNHPPGPVTVALGEIVIHSADIRRPLGLTGGAGPDATVACLDLYKNASFPFGSKKRIAGLRLVATDADWSHGEGPEVTGPALVLLLAMTGRHEGLPELSGPGEATLRSRLAAAAAS